MNERRNPNNKNFQAAAAEVGRVHYYLGWIDSKEKRFKESAVHFGEAAKHSGGREAKDGTSLAADAALQQGIALVEANDLENAAKHLQHVGNQYREHPRRDLILYYTGLAFTRVKNWGTASGFFKQVVENYPKLHSRTRPPMSGPGASGRKSETRKRLNVTNYCSSSTRKAPW